MEDKPIFSSTGDRKDFWIAIGVILLAGVFIFYHTLRSNEPFTPPNVEQVIQLSEDTPPSQSTASLQLDPSENQETISKHEKDRQEVSDASAEEVIHQNGTSSETSAYEANTTSLDKDKEPTSTLESSETKAEAPKTDKTSEEKPAIAEQVFLVVHSFARARNATAFEQKLEADGYETKSMKRPNGWTAVGVLFDPQVVNEEGLMQTLSEEYNAQPVRWEELESAN